MKIALVSLNQVWEDKLANKQLCQDYIEQASKYKTDLVIFPEMTLTGFSMNTMLIKEKADQSDTVSFFSKQAKQNNLFIAFGVVFEKNNKATNNLILIDNDGNVLSSFVKIHPFTFSGENNYYVGGDEINKCQINDAIIGLTICYDLRFPEIYQALSKNCNLIINVANWPEKRLKHWNILLQARAIENQSFIIGVNRTGLDGNKLSYAKSSIIFDPSGELVSPLESYRDMDIYDINLEVVKSIRNSFPMKQDRRIEFYKTLF
jgi:predicted amidohydrolase